MSNLKKTIINATLATALAVASANSAFAARGGSGGENGGCCGGGNGSSTNSGGGSGPSGQEYCTLRITDRTLDKGHSVHQGVVTLDGWKNIPVTFTFSEAVKNGKGKYSNPLGTININTIDRYCIRGLAKQHESSTGGNITNIKSGLFQKR